ncbi:MAG TPA: hypothetical protein PKL57_01210 [Candidatus Wallbacteria bacterium]|nr:hypothetical protein [Candidatus Wallbacteria bacterium]
MAGKFRIRLLLTAAAICAIFWAGGAYSQTVSTADYDPVTLYKIGLAWDYPPYLLVDLPAVPGDLLLSQGPFPYIAPVMQKSGWITGHSGLYAGRKDHDGDGVEEFVTAESARYGVWYGYFYPMHRFEKGHGRMGEYLKTDTTVTKLLKKVFGEDVSEKNMVKKYDDLLDGTYMGARSIDALTESPDEFSLRRKILEFAHNYILKNSKYSYDGFKQPILSIFNSLNTHGTGGYGKGHAEMFTCVGLTEASYEYAGLDVVPKYVEETNVGLTPLKQFLYSKPVSKIFVKKGETQSFGVWHIIHGHKNYEPQVICEPVPEGCSFDGREFKIDSSKMNPGTYEIEFRSAQYADQKQKVSVIITLANQLPEFDFKDVAKNYKGLGRASDEVSQKVALAVTEAKKANKKERDQKMMACLDYCKSVDDVVTVAKNVENGAARDIVLLSGLKYAGGINDLYKLAMFTDSNITVNKILFAPLGYAVPGISAVINKIRNSGAFSLFFNRECAKELKKLTSSDFVFSHSVNIAFKISFKDIASMNAQKIKGYLKFLCANPKELNKLENSYLISLIQKRVYFAIASGDKAADEIRRIVAEMFNEAVSKVKVEENPNRMNILSDEQNVARFLNTMVQSFDVKGGWLEKSFEAEKAFMSGVYASAAPVPGLASAMNAAMGSASEGPFAELKIKGSLSPELISKIDADNGTNFSLNLSAAPEDNSAAGQGGQTSVLGADSSVPAAAEAEAAQSSDPRVKSAYEKYKVSYKKYVNAVNSQAGEREMNALTEELKANFAEYQSALGR